jgi:hypothetical protein
VFVITNLPETNRDLIGFLPRWNENVNAEGNALYIAAVATGQNH